MFRKIAVDCARVALVAALAVYALVGSVYSLDTLALLVGPWWAFGWKFVSFFLIITWIRRFMLMRRESKRSLVVEHDILPYGDVQ